MKVLMISWDTSITKGSVNDDDWTIQRMRMYGEAVEGLRIISYSRRSGSNIKREISKRVMAYPSQTKNVLRFQHDVVSLAKKIHEDFPFDVVTTQDPFLTGKAGLAIKKRFGCPVNIQMHGDFISNPYWLKSSIKNRILNLNVKKTIMKADSIRVVSDRIRRSLVEIGYDRRSIFKVPIYPDPHFGMKDDLKVDPPKGKTSRLELLFVGRLAPEKNLKVLIEAIEKLRSMKEKVHLTVVGEGTERGQLERLVAKKDLGSMVSFKGHIPHNELPRSYQASDILILPSKAEGWGMVTLEALSFGVPVIMTDVGCAGEVVIDNENGLIVPIDDLHALTSAIRTLVKDEGLRTTLGRNGPKTIKRFSDFQGCVDAITRMLVLTVERSKART